MSKQELASASVNLALARGARMDSVGSSKGVRLIAGANACPTLSDQTLPSRALTLLEV